MANQPISVSDVARACCHLLSDEFALLGVRSRIAPKFLVLGEPGQFNVVYDLPDVHPTMAFGDLPGLFRQTISGVACAIAQRADGLLVTMFQVPPLELPGVESYQMTDMGNGASLNVDLAFHVLYMKMMARVTAAYRIGEVVEAEPPKIGAPINLRPPVSFRGKRP